MGAQVPAQGVTAAAGVAAHGAFERLFSGVQFDVAKQVSLLGKGGPTLSAVEWPLALEGGRRERERETHCESYSAHFNMCSFMIERKVSREVIYRRLSALAR